MQCLDFLVVAVVLFFCIVFRVRLICKLFFVIFLFSTDERISECICVCVQNNSFYALEFDLSSSSDPGCFLYAAAALACAAVVVVLLVAYENGKSRTRLLRIRIVR